MMAWREQKHYYSETQEGDTVFLLAPEKFKTCSQFYHIYNIDKNFQYI